MNPSLVDDIKVGIKGSWFMNHELASWSHRLKICKTSIFHELFFPKSDKSDQHRHCVCLYLSRNKWVGLKDGRTKWCILFCYTFLNRKRFSRNNMFS